MTDAPELGLVLSVWGFPWGLPWLAICGAAIAVVGVWLLSRAMRTDAWTTAGRLLAPPGALGRALLPLLLTAVVVSAFALQVLGWPLQLASGALLAALVWLFVRGAGEFTHERTNAAELTDALRLSTPYPWAALAIPAAVGVVSAALFLVAGFGDQLGTWKSTAGWSGLAEYGALVLVVAAASLRVFGYATNWRRAVVAVALAVLFVRGLSWSGVSSGERTWNRVGLPPTRTSFVLLVVIGVTLAAETWALRGSPASVPSQTQRFGRAGGFWAAVVASAILALALTSAALETTVGPSQLPRDAFGSIEPTPAPKILEAGGDDDLNLGWTFAPVLRLRRDEDYPPVPVEVFLNGSTQTGAKGATDINGDQLPLTVEDLPTECPDGSHEACGTINCPQCLSRTREHQPTGFIPQGTFYTRVAHRGTEPRVLAGWNPWGNDLDTLLQYWIFYAYDRWEAETVIGRLTQEHEGDWEHVSLGLDAAHKPLFVALSAHCGGQVVPWAAIEAAPGELRGGRVVISRQRSGPSEDVSHPLVAVARGSHANYAVAGGHRPPDWGSCKHLPSEALTALSYASNVRDLTDDGNTGWFAYPTEIAIVTDQTRPMSYPGAWGSGETITFGHRKPSKTARGPLSPPLQGASWRTPIKLYFCGSHWHGDSSESSRLHGTRQECGQ